MTNKLETFVRKVREMAKRYPDARYQSPGGGSCFNNLGIVRDGPPTEGCIIGQCARELEPDKFKFVRGALPARDTVANLGYLQKGEEDGPLICWLYKVQEEQDTGKPWAQAVEAADQYVQRGFPGVTLP